MTIEDDAPLFNPIAHSTLALEAGIDDREPGGLGLVLVKNMVDDMTDERRDNKNTLTLKKNRQPV
ncbi:MAG: ATP-binding protein [Gemmatimonadota bacterium]|nr:ATP-binding protein [Gemmatimonadota bacterium]